jgi:putative protein-disulfide isomerase
MKKCRLITVYDPLCGWCYGFGPVLNQLHASYADRLDFDILSGGMITGSAVGPLSNMAAFISKAYPAVESATGIKFGQGFLNRLKDGGAIFSSLEPANVLSVMKDLFPEDSIAASHEIQELIYSEGIDPVNYEAYLPIFRKRGAADKLVLERLSSAETSQQSVLEFAQVNQWGIRGFPACIIETPSGKLYGISNGFLPLADLELKVQPFLVPEHP